MSRFLIKVWTTVNKKDCVLFVKHASQRCSMSLVFVYSSESSMSAFILGIELSGRLYKLKISRMSAIVDKGVLKYDSLNNSESGGKL